MSNLSKYRKSTVAVLTALLIIAIAAPLFSFAAAAGAPTASLGTSSGPNGTTIKVSGQGFNALDTVANLAVTIDGLPGKAITTSGTGALGASASIAADYQLKTDANGVLSGYIVICNLTAGSHTVIISDAATSVVAGTFTITKPTVTISPSAVVAGGSVTVSATGLPTTNSKIVSMKYNITAANFSGNVINVASSTSTNNPYILSSNKVSSSILTGYTGTYSATVSLPAVNPSYGAIFNLTDSWNNVGGATLSLTTPTVTLSPASGPVGTTVTATLTGFGPSATLASASIGNVVGSTTPITVGIPSSPVTTEQGTSVFVFQVPAGSTTTKSGVAGAQTVTVVDDKGNVGTATFTVTPKVAITLGTAATDSGTTFVPAGANAVIRINVTGFNPEAVLTFGYSPNVPTEWTTPSTTTWSPATQINTDNQLLTDKNGAVDTIITATGVAPSQIGQYWISVSDGVNTITTTFNVVSSGDILAVPVATGAAGQTGILIKYFGTTPTGVTLGGKDAFPTSIGTASAWPNAATALITVPTTASGVQRVAITNGAFNTVPFTTISPSATVVSPSSAAVGTTVTVVGNGFASTPASLYIDGATVTTASSSILGNTLLATFVVPGYLPGTYSLSIADAVNSATTSFTVAASTIQVTPSTSAPTNALGQKVTIAITGSGFKVNDTLTVKFEPNFITGTTYTGLTVVNTNGGILILSGYEIPTATTAGTHTITVQGASGAYAQATFTITPKLNSLPAVRPGQAVAISGIGFAANSVQTLTVNGTATTWLNVGATPAIALPQNTVVKTQANGNTYNTYTVGFIVPTTETSTALHIVVTDASGNSAATDLTVLAAPAITLGSAAVIAGTPSNMGVSINGTGFTPSSLRTGTPSTPISAALYSGSTFVSQVNLYNISTPVTGNWEVKDTGALTTMNFTIPTSVTAGTYTLTVTIGNAGVSTPVETASTTVTVLGAPSLVAPTSAASGSNVTITVSGLTAISSATFNGVPIAAAKFGPTTVPNSGANAYTTTTWFIVPTTEFAGSYLLTILDSNTNLVVQAAMQVTPSIALSATTGSKGTTILVNGTGFAATSTLTAKVNGVAVALNATTSSKSDATGAFVSTAFIIPVTAVATNTLTITDAAGNTAQAAFNVTAPTLTLPAAAQAGATVQIIGDGFAPGSPIVIQVGGSVVTTVPSTVTANAAGSFIAYVTAPSANSTVTATDNSNNIGTATLVVGGSTGNTALPNQTTMTTTAQTTGANGQAATTFTAGTSTVNAGFVLQTTGSPRDVVVAVTWQGPGGRVYNMASFQTTMDSNARTVSFSNLIPAGVTGTWTVQLQVFAADGVTALGVTTLTFTAQ